MDAPSSEHGLTAADGRIPGRRGRETRERLLASTSALLASRAYREVKVVDIARAAGASPATFYQYFSDVEAAILVLAQRAAQDGAALVAPFQGANWRGRAATETATSLVDAFLAFWRSHTLVMRVISASAICATSC